MSLRPSRRTVIAGLAASSTGVAHAGERHEFLIDDHQPGAMISPLVFGSNEIGAMDGGPLAAELDKAAGVTVRRLGGDLMTGYNWTNNAAHAGKNHKHANGAFLLEAMRIPRARWDEPAIVIEAMHDASLAMGAKSLVTLPLGNFVAGDRNGEVSTDDTAPSRRFVPVVWGSERAATEPVDADTCDVPHLLRRLIARYGRADTPTGIHGYILDNEPGIWFQNHPRLSRNRLGGDELISRSIAAARVIKRLDPAAMVLGPASWGATEFVSFQDAPDWPRSRRETFLARYLSAFREASLADGQRLLDCLDVHWYPFSDAGPMFRSEDPKLDQARLDAPRGLNEDGYTERSWVPRALARSQDLSLPILPSLKRLAERHFPGTGLAVTEFNYGGAGQLTSGLALADVLGRFAASGVTIATHWGSLAGWLGDAYRLYRRGSRAFSGRHINVRSSSPARVTAYGVRDEEGEVQLVVINKGREPVTVVPKFHGRSKRLTQVVGFDGALGKTHDLPAENLASETLTLPALSARRYVFT